MWMQAAADTADSIYAIERTNLSTVCALANVSCPRPKEQNARRNHHTAHDILPVTWDEVWKADCLAAKRAFYLATRRFGYRYSDNDTAVFRQNVATNMR